MKIDHIFIFSNKGQEADELVEFGLTEGSGRTHPGLGTANRRFFFENFYLEILWVENEADATSESSSSLKIWERSNFRNNNYAPYGLCFENREDSNPLFENAFKFQPDYYPAGKHIEVFTHEEKPYLPWVFRLPVAPGNKRISGEPTNHGDIGIKELTKAVFELRMTEVEDEIINIVQSNSAVEFRAASKDLLILEFDDGRQGKTKRFEPLNLEIQY